MKANELIVVKQLPVIVEQLKVVSDDVKKRISAVLEMDCTEETKTALKKERAALNTEFAEYEERRKAVKQAVLSPYEQFQAVYDELISGKFKAADAKLKARIDEVERVQKEEKEADVREYFAECAADAGIDFVTFEQAGINVTLTATAKKLKEQAAEFISRIKSDLRLIEAQQYRDEIMVEYRKTLNCSAAVTSVSERHRALNEEAARKAKAEEIKAQEAAVVKKVEEAAPLAPPVEVKVQEDDPVLTVAFRVTATKSKLKELKAFLNDGGYEYE